MLGSVHPISTPQERRSLPAAPVRRLTSENRHVSEDIEAIEAIEVTRLPASTQYKYLILFDDAES